MSDHDLAALGDALKQLQHLEPELASLVDCRFFAGMTEAETAQALGMSERTVRRKWLRARAFIHHQLRDV
jgi:RNA polymerase sigma factor (sigma-70 family)